MNKKKTDPAINVDPKIISVIRKTYPLKIAKEITEIQPIKPNNRPKKCYE